MNIRNWLDRMRRRGTEHRWRAGEDLGNDYYAWWLETHFRNTKQWKVFETFSVGKKGDYVEAVMRGAWLAERVWEPSLPRSLVRAGIEYVPLDDAHFLGVGVPDRRLYDSFLTEEEAMPLRVFPVPSALRRMI